MTQRKPSSYYGATIRIIGIAGLAIALVAMGRMAFLDSLRRDGFAAPAPLPPASALAKPTEVSAAGFTLVSQSIELPDTDETYPAGPGADVINANCTACHSASMAQNQPALTGAQWTATVTKMRDTYKASISASDIPRIVRYLEAMPSQKSGTKTEGRSAQGATG